MCFDGTVRVFYALVDRNRNEKENWYDRECHLIKDIIDPSSPEMDTGFVLPDCINEMVEFAEKLSQGIKFVRVDLYEDNERFFFGEMTFFHCGGFLRMQPEKWEEKLGSWIEI